MSVDIKVETKNVKSLCTRRKSNIPLFEELKISTKTVVVYSNVKVDIEELFRNLPVEKIENIPVTKKKKRPDIKKIRGKYGSIISLRHRDEYRGIVTKPERIELHSLRQKERNGTISNEEMERLEVINIEQKSLDFRNQACCILSLTKSDDLIPTNINMMIFKDVIKIVGCRSDEIAQNVVKIMWKYIYLYTTKYTLLDSKPPRYLFDCVMNNIDFFLGFNLRRDHLNTLMNDPEYSEIVRQSIFDPSGNTNVNISMFSYTPPDFSYIVFEFNNATDYNIVEEKRNIYKELKKKPKKKESTTFLVFRSSKVILTGKHLSEMKKAYYCFWNVVNKNRDYIEEKLSTIK